MEASGDTLVWWILAVAFVGVGIHLYFYGRRRSAMLRRFASRHGLSHNARPPASLEEELTRTFDPDERGVTRAFSSVRDVVSDDRVRLFRCIELLDLSTWGTARSTHYNRLAALFPVKGNHAHWAMYDSRGRRLDGAVPEVRSADETVARIVEGTLAAHPPRHTLSVTLSRGRGLAYLETRIYGTETEEELLYLLELGRRLAARLGTAAGANPAV